MLILTCIYVRIFAAASKNSRDIRRNSFHQSITASRRSEVRGRGIGGTATEDCYDDVNEDDKVNQKKAFLQNTTAAAEMGPPDKTSIPMNSSAPDFLSTIEQNKGTTCYFIIGCQILYRRLVVCL